MLTCFPSSWNGVALGCHFFIRFVCEGTVEDKILQLQKRKKILAQQVLSGKGDTFAKLTLADLKILFDI